jgi:hypothetical protein
MSLDCDVAQDIKRDFAVQYFDRVCWMQKVGGQSNKILEERFGSDFLTTVRIGFSWKGF